MFWTIVLVLLIIFVLKQLNKDYVVTALFAKRLKTSDGTPIESVVASPKATSKFGVAFDTVGLDPEGLFKYTRHLTAEMKKGYVMYVFGGVFYNIISAEDAESILSDPNLTAKGVVYKFMEPFLGLGLLTASGKLWYSRRKMLTPAFHFNILSQFEEIFKSESMKFVDNMLKSKEEVFSLDQIIPKFTLNNVCETALGIKLDEQNDSDKYRKSFKVIDKSFVDRVSNPFYMSDTIYNLFAASAYTEHIKNIHEFSSNIIQKRRILFDKESEQKESEERGEYDIGKKKRYAMLDTLLLAEREGLIDHKGICAEVNTFMFAGFDTTSIGITFALMNLALYPKLQERCYEEIMENIDADLENLDVSQINNLKYLDCFIKETLRLYPPVPVIMRKAVTETKLANNVIVPAGAFVTVHIYDIHRDPRHFSSPTEFDPDRFQTDNATGRHPFAFVPFSAGQRNCIGQKFSLLEIKTLLVHVLRHFKLFPKDPEGMDPKDLQFEVGITLRMKNDIKLRFVRR